MKPLSELLKHYVEKSNYTIYSLSYNSKVNRTTLQRALSGERPISPENLKKILPFLNLTLAEKKELDQAMLISQIGENTYQEHLYIKELLERTELNGSVKSDESNIPFPSLFSPITTPRIVKGMFNIIKVICQIASYQTEHEGAPFLNVVAGFHNRFFCDLYEQFQIPYYHNLKIRHIVPFVKNTRENSESSLFNLQVLSTLLPFALSNPRNCTLYYCYEINDIARTYAIPFTYYIVCNHNVILLTSDCESAMILPDASVSFYLQHFQRISQNAQTLFENQDTSSLLSTFSTLLINTSHLCSIEFQPCITAFLDQNIVSESINQELPKEHQQFLCNMLLTQAANLKELSDSIFVFTKRGYKDFVQNGIIYQIPLELYHPLCIKDRITILNRLIQSNQTGQSKFYMMKEDCFYPQMEIFTYDSTSLLFNCIQSGEKDARTCIIKEPNIINAFNDFIRNLPNHNLIYNAEETSDIFKNSIMELKNNITTPPNIRSWSIKKRERLSRPRFLRFLVISFILFFT